MLGDLGTDSELVEKNSVKYISVWLPCFVGAEVLGGDFSSNDLFYLGSFSVF